MTGISYELLISACVINTLLTPGMADTHQYISLRQVMSHQRHPEHTPNTSVDKMSAVRRACFRHCSTSVIINVKQGLQQSRRKQMCCMCVCCFGWAYEFPSPCRIRSGTAEGSFRGELNMNFQNIMTIPNFQNAGKALV